MATLALSTAQELSYYNKLRRDGYTTSQACDIIFCIREEYAENMDKYPLKDELGFFKNITEDAD